MRAIRIILTTITLALAVCPNARADDKAEAIKHFKAGVTLIKAEDFAAAAVAFETALRLYPTRMVLFNLANCYKALQRYGEALEMVRRLESEFAGKLGDELEAEVLVFRESIENLVGTLTVEVRPAGASISVGGRRVGTSPLAEALVLGPGDYEVEVSLAGHATEQRTVRVESRGRAKISLALERHKGQIRITTETEGARVLLDGVEVGRTPLDEPLAVDPGKRRVRLELEGFESMEREVEVSAEQQAVLFLSMVQIGKRSTRGRPASEEGASDHGPRDEPGAAGALRWVGLGLTLASGAATGVFYGLAGRSKGDFEDARDEYEALGDDTSAGLAERESAAWSAMDAARGDMQRFGKLGLGFGIATGVLAAATVVLFVKAGSSESESDGPAVSAVPGGLSVSF